MTNNQPKKCVPDGKEYNQSGLETALKCKDCGNYWIKKHSIPDCHPVEIQGEEKICWHVKDIKSPTHCVLCGVKLDTSPLPKERGGWIERFREKSKGKVVSHLFDGSCCYNDNEGGKGHKECRYPYNPGMENPTGEQCLKLREEHFDIKSFIAEEIEKAVDEGFKKGLEKGWREAKRLYDRN